MIRWGDGMKKLLFSAEAVKKILDDVARAGRKEGGSNGKQSTSKSQ